MILKFKSTIELLSYTFENGVDNKRPTNKDNGLWLTRIGLAREKCFFSEIFAIGDTAVTVLIRATFDKIADTERITE